ncbi:MAG: hypothetical protein FWG93_00085 [Oscillospiraceae bacterium]|nr:hypothetical protein [Oscillospiraceae bacterium]
MPGLGKEVFQNMKTVEDQYLTTEMNIQALFFQQKGAMNGDVPGLKPQEMPPKPTLYHTDDMATLRILRDMEKDVDPANATLKASVGEYQKQCYSSLQNLSLLRTKNAFLGKLISGIDNVAASLNLSDVEKQRALDTLTEVKRRGDAKIQADKLYIDNSVRQFSNDLKGEPTVTSNGVVQYAHEPEFKESRFFHIFNADVEKRRQEAFDGFFGQQFPDKGFNILENGVRITIGGVTYELIDETGKKSDGPDKSGIQLRALEGPERTVDLNDPELDAPESPQQSQAPKKSGLLAIEYPEQSQPSMVQEEPQAIEIDIPDHDFVMVNKEEIDMNDLKDPTPSRSPSFWDSITDMVNSAVAFGKSILQALKIIGPDLPTLNPDHTLSGPTVTEPAKVSQPKERSV